MKRSALAILVVGAIFILLTSALGLRHGVFGFWLITLESVVLALIIFPAVRKAVGIVLVVLGILACISVVGLIVGVPMVFIGALFFYIGSSKEKIVVEKIVEKPRPPPTPPHSTVDIAKTETFPSLREVVETMTSQHGNTCPVCGKPMKLTSEEGDRWYCHRDDVLVVHGVEVHWNGEPVRRTAPTSGQPMQTAVAQTPEPSQQVSAVNWVFCYYCSNKIPEDARFCRKCGREQSVPS